MEHYSLCGDQRERCRMERLRWQNLVHRQTSSTTSPSETLPPKVSSVFQHHCQLKGKLQHINLGKHLKYKTVIYPRSLNADVPHTKQNEFNLSLRIPDTPNSPNTVQMSSETHDILSVEAMENHKEPYTCVQHPVASEHSLCKKRGWQTVRGNQTRMRTKANTAKLKSLGFVRHPEYVMDNTSSNQLGNPHSCGLAGALQLLLLFETESILCLQLS